MTPEEKIQQLEKNAKVLMGTVAILTERVGAQAVLQCLSDHQVSELKTAIDELSSMGVGQ